MSAGNQPGRRLSPFGTCRRCRSDAGCRRLCRRARGTRPITPERVPQPRLRTSAGRIEGSTKPVILNLPRIGVSAKPSSAREQKCRCRPQFRRERHCIRRSSAAMWGSKSQPLYRNPTASVISESARNRRRRPVRGDLPTKWFRRPSPRIPQWRFLSFAAVSMKPNVLHPSRRHIPARTTSNRAVVERERGKDPSRCASPTGRRACEVVPAVASLGRFTRSGGHADRMVEKYFP